VGDIVGLYLNPPDRAIVLCVDEKSVKVRKASRRSGGGGRAPVAR
jgi:hypothetical protein